MKILFTLVLMTVSALAHASAPTTIQADPFVTDKRAHKVEKTQVVQNTDGTFTVSAVLVYEDGSKESCTLVLKASASPNNKLALSPQSRTCSLIDEKAQTND